jgi:hypothetical protein
MSASPPLSGSRIKSLFVIARNSSFTYRGRTIDVKQVGRELGVRYVLEGSVRKVSNRVRINAQLVDGVTGVHVWAERYDRKFEDIFALQDEISLSVVGAIEASLRQAEVKRVNARLPMIPLTHWRTVLRRWAITIAFFARVCVKRIERPRSVTLRRRSLMGRMMRSP